MLWNMLKSTWQRGPGAKLPTSFGSTIYLHFFLALLFKFESSVAEWKSRRKKTIFRMFMNVWEFMGKCADVSVHESVCLHVCHYACEEMCLWDFIKSCCLVIVPWKLYSLLLLKSLSEGHYYLWGKLKRVY